MTGFGASCCGWPSRYDFSPSLRRFQELASTKPIGNQAARRNLIGVAIYDTSLFMLTLTTVVAWNFKSGAGFYALCFCRAYSCVWVINIFRLPPKKNILEAEFPQQ
jgi:hypothetical protein